MSMTIEFSAVRASVAHAVKQAEQARALRIESIDRQLPALESDLVTKQQEVAALRAERERLQAQTGAQIVAGMVTPIAGQVDAFDLLSDDEQDRIVALFEAWADAAEKKESGPLKVGDRVEVPEGVRSVSGRQVDSGRYGVDRVFHDGDIGLNEGSIVRASDVRRV